jgi:hypothetical protein
MLKDRTERETESVGLTIGGAFEAGEGVSGGAISGGWPRTLGDQMRRRTGSCGVAEAFVHGGDGGGGGRRRSSKMIRGGVFKGGGRIERIRRGNVSERSRVVLVGKRTRRGGEIGCGGRWCSSVG